MLEFAAQGHIFDCDVGVGGGRSGSKVQNFPHSCPDKLGDDALRRFAWNGDNSTFDFFYPARRTFRNRLDPF